MKPGHRLKRNLLKQLRKSNGFVWGTVAYYHVLGNRLPKNWTDKIPECS